MIAELIVVAVLIATGWGLLSLLNGVPQSARIWLALPVGAAVYMSVALFSLALCDTLTPRIALSVVGVIGFLALLTAMSCRQSDFYSLVWLAVALSIGVFTVVLVRLVHLTRLTSDSLQYLAMSENMQHSTDQIGSYFLLHRQIGLPALHALSEFTDRRYLASIGPMFGVACIGFFTWTVWTVTRRTSLARRTTMVFTAALVLIASNRLVYDFFYINTHMQMATFVLIAVVGAWLAVVERQWVWALPAGLALSATMLLRAEAPLVAAIFLVALGTTRATFATRLSVTIPSALVAALWYGGILLLHSEEALVVLGNPAAVAGATLLVILGGISQLHNLARYSGVAMLVVLTLGLIALALGTPDVLFDAVIATARNLTSDGMWMATWPVILVLGVVALLVHRIPEGTLWTTSVIGFGILFWLLPLLRGGPWRVGTGDSGNRILAHFLPVVALFIVLAAIDRWPFVSMDQRTADAVPDAVEGDYEARASSKTRSSSPRDTTTGPD